MSVRPIHLHTVTKGVGLYARHTEILDKDYNIIAIIFPWAKEIVVNKDYGYSVREESAEYFGEKLHPSDVATFLECPKKFQFKQIDDKTQKLLRDARKHLSIASTQIHMSSRNVSPFRRSKFLNVLGKESGQLGIELAIFLGDIEFRDNAMAGWEVRNQPSLNILRAMVEEGELG